MTRINIIGILCGCAATLIVGTACAATLQIANPSVVLIAGQTVEIPLSSTQPIAPDLRASGHFETEDISFTAGPGCHLSANGCTLLIKAAPTSKNYTAEPVTITESAATNAPLLTLTVINPRGYIPDTRPAIINSQPLIISTQKDNQKKWQQTAAKMTNTANHPQASLQRSGNRSFYGVAEPHPGLLRVLTETNNDFTPTTNGPVYQIVRLTNYAVTQPLFVSIIGPGARAFSLDDKGADYGVNQNCATMTNIASGNSCLVIVKGKIGNPQQAPQTATLIIQGNNNNIATFKLSNTTYVYAAGGFDTLGNATVSGGDLLAECTAGSCSNALQGTTGNNYASTNSSVGKWINALAITPAGNLMVGGAFGEIGGATSGATSGTAALLAQCTPGSVVGNACINQINQTGSLTNANAFNNGYIDAITIPFAISSSNFMVIGGDFSNMRAFSAASSGKMLAKCAYNGTSANQTCNNYMTTGGASSTKYANNAVSALNTLGSTSSAPLVHAGGLFTQIAGYPTSAPGSGTTFASCTSTSTGSCNQGMDANPNNSILGMTDDGNNLYIGGVFTQIGGYIDSSGGYPLVTCTPATPTTCLNALSESNDANGYIEGMIYSGGYLYVGGRFTTIGGATPVNSGNMLAVCTAGGTCSNFVTDINPYASGTDWGGNIAAVTIGDQVSITAN